MLFTFLKYLQPTHYFQCTDVNGNSIFPKYHLLEESVKAQLTKDLLFSSENAQNYDLSWQAIQKGYVGDAERFQVFETLPLVDNYRFIRKYFNSVWVFYVLLLRLISFKNPFKEISAWMRSKNMKRANLAQNPLDRSAWAFFNSELISNAPKVSVIIPTLNRYPELTNVLKDFENQSYSNFEIIVVDQSDDFNRNFYDQFKLDFKIINQKEKALWLARNTAIKSSANEIIALSEDDVRFEKDWLFNHLKCLDFFNCDISAGVFYPEGGQMPKERSFFARSSQFATGNTVLYKKVFKKVGLFDRQFEKQRMGDGEFGLRAFKAGVKSVSNPKAYCLDVKAASGGLREMGSWDAFRPTNLLAPRPVPSVVYFFRRYYGKKRTRLSLLRTVPLSIMPYQFKKNKMAMVLGALVTVLLLPFVIFQVLKSWNLAKNKIKQGPLIETLA
ncbi:MAG: glycosyltransferase family 2 protein [Bacteroidia bacterium]|nr:glycosyltransferase family 2 protein [Bacteroidia bacterium]